MKHLEEETKSKRKTKQQQKPSKSFKKLIYESKTHLGVIQETIDLFSFIFHRAQKNSAQFIALISQYDTPFTGSQQIPTLQIKFP